MSSSPMPKNKQAKDNKSNTTEKKKPSVHKIVVLGEGGVGKSAVTLQFVSHIFTETHDPTIEDAYQSQVVIDDQACMLDILDTAGQEEFAAMREQYMRHGEGFIFVYSITDAQSFHMLPKHLKTLERVRNFEPVPVVLIGNKSDLEERRQVSQSEGASLAHEIDSPFLETSAQYRKNIEEAFFAIVREIRKRDSDKEDGQHEKIQRKKGLLKRVRKFLKGLSSKH